jgi:hypothetical protein
MNPRFTGEDAVRLGRLLLILFFLAICLTIPEQAWGQQVTAAITGKVTDPSDAAIVGSKVVAKDIARLSAKYLVSEPGKRMLRCNVNFT